MSKIISFACWTVFLVGIYFFIQQTAKNEVAMLEQWPESVSKNNYSYCNPSTLNNCRTGEWVGFLDSELPKFSKGISPQSIYDVRYVYCEKIGTPPSNKNYRIIKINDSDSLYLCRLDQEKNILEKADAAIESVKT